MIDFSKLSRVCDSMNSKPAPKALIRKQIKDSDVSIEDIQKQLAANGYAVSLEELQAAREQFENDIQDSRNVTDESMKAKFRKDSPAFDEDFCSYEVGGSWCAFGRDATAVRQFAEARGFECWPPEEDTASEDPAYVIYTAYDNLPEKECFDYGDDVCSEERWNALKRKVNEAEGITDSRKRVKDANRKKLDSKRRVKDSLAKKRKVALKKKIKDAMEDTEDTAGAIAAAIDALDEDTPAADAVEAVIEILGDVIDKLEEPAESKSTDGESPE